MFRRRIGAALLPIFAPLLVKLLSWTWRIERLGEDNYREVREAEGTLFAIWHGRMLVGLAPHRSHGLTVLVSPSDDGSLIKSLLRRFDFGVVRGSSSKGGARALRELVGLLREGGRIVITPDGPRGPHQGMNEGLAWMAKATGFPVLACGLVCDRAWHLPSWDQFTIPKFGARIAVVYGPGMTLSRRSTEEELRTFTRQIRASLLDAEARGFRHLGVEPDFDREG